MSILQVAENAGTDTLAHQDFLRLASPFRLVSLWDMLRFHADDLYLLTKTLRWQIETASNDARQFKAKPPADPLMVCEASWQRVERFLDDLEKVCEKLDLDRAKDKIDHIKGMNISINVENYFVFLPSDLSELATLIGKQLPDRMLMFVPECDAEYLNDKLFGDKVYEKFPASQEDIACAGRCLAIGNADGAVFYLMRVLESAIKRLAQTLRVPATGLGKMTWGEMLGKIRDAIKAIPAKTSRDQKYSEIAAHLRHCKNAWRDPVSHSRKRFTREEAIATFNHVKIFMKHLAGSDS